MINRIADYIGRLPIYVGTIIVVSAAIISALAIEQAWEYILLTFAEDNPYRKQIKIVLTAICVAVPLGMVIATMFQRNVKSRIRLKVEKDVAELASRAKTDFLATMSHEIRTPMSGILGAADLLVRQPLDPQSLHYARAIQQSGEMLMSLLNEILDLSKIEAGQLALEERDFSMADLLHEIEEIMSGSAAKKSIDLVVTSNGEAGGWFFGDSNRLRQILFNLVNNAIKFTDEGEVTLSVSHSGRQRVGDRIHHRLRFEVSDTGIGIAPDVLPKLFDKFAQADISTNRKYGGSGLGLSISTQLCELMGGKLIAESRLGFGSIFSFTLVLPAGKVSAKKSDGLRRLEELCAAAPAPPKPLRILLAEDHAVNQMIVESMLTQFGHWLDIVDNGLEAVEALNSETYDLVLMDMNMPGMGGEEVVQKLRAGDMGADDVPVIALTANAMAGDRERYLAMGFDDYVAKPIDRYALLSSVVHISGVPVDLTQISKAPPPLKRRDPVSNDALNDVLSDLERDLA